MTTELLNRHGWTVECQSPFEIQHQDGSAATQQAAHIVQSHLEELEARENPDMFKRTISVSFGEYNALHNQAEKWKFARDWLKNENPQLYYKLLDLGVEKGVF